MRKVYLDYNAATPVDPEVKEAMIPYLGEEFGNPSSLHWAGGRAKKALDESREKIARCLSCRPEEIYFTSGGTESINLAVKGVIIPGSHLITTQIEHKAVLESVEDLEREGRIEVTRLSVDSSGDIDLEELKSAIRENTVLVSVMFVNNEIGNIYPITAIGRICRERGIFFHTDAVQALGKLPIDLSLLPVDLTSFSAHKIYGPKGVGALYIKRGVKIRSLIHGGAQEMEKRGGTENLPGIVGFAEAVRKADQGLDLESERVRRLRDRLQNQLVASVPGTKIHGNPDHRVANTLNLSFEGIESELILIALDREGIAVSSGSACASGAVKPSHVLLAMGVKPGKAKGAIRFSLGRGTTENDIDYVLQKMSEIVKRLRQ
jgi:cysteine desulfurase